MWFLDWCGLFNNYIYSVQFSSVQLLSHVRLSVTPWTAAREASLSITNSWSLLNSCPLSWWCHPTISFLCHPLLLPPSIFPSIRVFSNESVFRIRWPKYWSFSFSISPSNEYSGLISFRMDWSWPITTLLWSPPCFPLFFQCPLPHICSAYPHSLHTPALFSLQLLSTICKCDSPRFQWFLQTKT